MATSHINVDEATPIIALTYPVGDALAVVLHEDLDVDAGDPRAAVPQRAVPPLKVDLVPRPRTVAHSRLHLHSVIKTVISKAI